MTIPDPYAALNLPHSATDLQIKTSYRQLARKFHPDTWSLPCFSDADKKEATLKFTEISNAYALLSDADEKAEYDRTYRLGGYDTTSSGDNAGSRTTNNPNRSGNGWPRPAPAAAPPPPPPRPAPSQQQTSTGSWASAIDPVTRRMYYYNKQTGACSWELPSTAAANGNTRRTTSKNNSTCDDFGYQEMDRTQDWQGRQQEQDTSYYGRRIDSHQCESFVALVLCPPIGLIAMYHSIRADRYRRRGLYNEAFHHARQAPKYSCLAKVIGIGFWIYYYIVVVRENDIEWPDFDFDFGDWGNRRLNE